MTRWQLAALAGAFLAALLIARASAEGPARLMWFADDSGGICTAGRTAEVLWSAVRGDQPLTDMRINGVAQEGESGVALVRCPPLRSDWRTWAARYGMQHWTRSWRYEVHGTALAPDGTEVSAHRELRVRPPQPPLRDITVSSWPWYNQLEIKFRHTGRFDGRIAARWRDAGGGEWQIGPSVSREISRYVDRDGRLHAYLHAWLDAGIYELQLAPVRSQGEVAGLAEADWSETVVLDISDDPPLVMAEATHDSIIVRSADGSAIAGLQWHLSGPCREDDGSARRSYPACSYDWPLAADTGETTAVRWNDLVPGSWHHLSWSDPELADDGWRSLFSVRTEPAPKGYEPELSGTGGIVVEVGARSVSLRWESPPGARHPYRIAAYDFGAEYAISELVEEAGPTHDMVVDGLRAGATYRIEVIRERPDGMEFGTRFIIETPEDDSDAALEDRPEAPIAEYEERPDHGYLFTRISAAVPDGDRWTEVEYEWRFGGRTMRRLSPEGLWLPEPLPGTYQIRARGNRDGLWSAWSEPAIVATRPLRPSSLRGTRTREGALISWSPDSNLPAPIEYVVRWWIDDGPETEIRGVAERSIVLPFAADTAGTLRGTVSAVHPELGESEQSFSFSVPLDQPLTAEMSSSKWYPCFPQEGEPCSVSLSISGGGAPYETRVGEHAETVDGGGYRLKIDYDVLAAEDGVAWEVRDALGAAVSGTYLRQPVEVYPYAALPHQVELGRLHATDEGEMIVLWYCRSRPLFDYLVRWRELGGRHWLYERQSLERSVEPWVDYWLGIGWHHENCQHFIDGLQPGVAYEVSVAVARIGAGLPNPDALRWSDTWVVTTPAEVGGIRISREEAGVRVSWNAQPDVRRYVVVLRGEGRSWWRIHDATGAERESALFDAPPASAGYTAGVRIPDGAEGGPAALAAS